MISTKIKIVTMSLLAIVILSLPRANGAIVFQLDAGLPTSTRIISATHIGVTMTNLSFTESVTITSASIEGLANIGGSYGLLSNPLDSSSRTEVGLIGTDGSLSTGGFTINPGENIYFTLQFSLVRTTIAYRRAAYTSGEPFEPDSSGPAVGILDEFGSFADGTFVGTAGTGSDDFAAISFDGFVGSVPEPSSAVLLGFGGMGLILRRRR